MVGCAMALGACAPTTNQTASPDFSPVKTAPLSLMYASYLTAGPEQTDQAGNSYRYSYSEKKNDTSGSFTKVNNAVRFQYSVGSGNAWSGAAIVAGVPGGKVTNLSSYLGGVLKIKVSAKNVNQLMIRIDGEKEKADEDKYCWQAISINVTSRVTEYVIPLDASRWSVLGYCSAAERQESLKAALSTIKEIHVISFWPQNIQNDEIVLESIAFEK